MSTVTNYTNILLINVLDQNPDPVSFEKTERGFFNNIDQKGTMIALAVMVAIGALVSGIGLGALFLGYGPWILIGTMGVLVITVIVLSLFDGKSPVVSR